MGAPQRISTSSLPAGPLGPIEPRDGWPEGTARRGGASAEATILNLLDAQAQQHPLNHALAVFTGGQWQGLTYSQLARRVRWMADDLRARFPDGGQPIAVLAESGPAWGIAALAILASRNVLVPLDATAGADTLGAMLNLVGPAVILASARYADTVRALSRAGASVGVALDLGDPFVHVDMPLPCEPEPSALGGSSASLPESAAVMAFTSGTTGEPKAVELGFDALLFEVRALTREFALRPSDRMLSVLPMHHMLEFTAGFLCPLWCGAEIYYLQSLLPGDALREMRARGISRMVTVPAWLALLRRELDRCAPDRDAEREPSSVAAHRAARRALGAEFEHFVCGGAPLPPDLGAYFDGLGVPVLEGYGLTETGPVVATNSARESRRGSVGRPLAGTETHIADDGEILVRGPQVAHRYHLALGASEPVTDEDGWLHTGDLGRLDDDGFLYVTGRSKNTIVLSSGKNVQPEEVEASLEGRAEIDEVGVVGLRGPNLACIEDLCAVIVPSAAFADACRSAGTDPGNALRRIVETSLGALAPFKRPRRIIVSARALPRTAAGKLRRSELSVWASEQAEAEA